MTPTLRYTVEPQDLLAHKLHIAIEASGLEKGRPVEFVLPVWSPGSYSIHENPRAMRQVEAKDAHGALLPLVKVEKNRWRVEAKGTDRVEFSYTLYGHELTTQGIHVTGDHIHLNAPHGLCYLEGALESPLEITVHPPTGWKVYTELPEAGKNPPRFRARNYDELADSPIEVGNPLEFTIQPAGVPHLVLFCGPSVEIPVHQVQEDLTKIVETTRRIFGNLPQSHYTFFYHLAERWDGGLEHATSTSIVMPLHIFRPRKSYEDFLSVSCHEYFHLFNVKRIRPKVLGPFDYTKENYTRLLWAMEGLTDYYGDYILRRAGLLKPKRYLEVLTRHIKTYRDGPGRLVQSLDESSFDTWIDHYKRYEETRNASVDYYLKGSLVSLCLDLEIRKRSGGTKDLDDVLRHLWAEYGARGIGLEEDGWQPAAEKATGLDLSDLFRDYIHGRTEVDFARHFAHVGLELTPEEKMEGKDDEEKPTGWLGIETDVVDSLPRVSVVIEGSPAQRAGLSPGDLLVAVGGMRVSYATLSDVLKRFEPGETPAVAFFRQGKLTSTEVNLGKPPAAKWNLKPKATPSDEEKRLLESWLSAPWSELTS